MSEEDFKKGQGMAWQNPQVPNVQANNVGSSDKANDINWGIAVEKERQENQRRQQQEDDNRRRANGQG